MKIEDNRTNLMFCELQVGDCFTFSEEYFIKIDAYATKSNAFSLSHNSKDNFNGDTKVIPVNAKVVIE